MAAFYLKAAIGLEMVRMAASEPKADMLVVRPAACRANTRCPDRGHKMASDAQRTYLSLRFPPIAKAVAPKLPPPARGLEKFVIVTPLGTSFLKSIL